MTPHDSVRKAAEAIRIHWTTQAQIGITELLPQKSFDEDTASIISLHCHVTEMEAVMEKCEKAVRSVDSYFRKHKIDATPDAAGLWIAVSNALASIDALKGDKR